MRRAPLRLIGAALLLASAGHAEPARIASVDTPDAARAQDPEPPRGENPAGDLLAPFFDRLATCQIEHFTEGGYLATAGSAFLVRTWRPDDLEAFAVQAAERRGRTGVRSARFLQLVHGSSFQASDAYRALAEWMRETGVESLERPDVSDAARAAFARRAEAEDLAGCATIKWGNRHPDLLSQPLPRPTWEAIARLFDDPELVDYPLNEVEAESIASGELTRAELLELRALRLAVPIFERQYAIMRYDEGGWIGNALDLTFVCTDEATTISFLVSRLQDEGLLEEFEQLGGRFAHRGGDGLLPNDHYAPMLLNRRTDRFFVIDTWLEDGGIPPYVDVLDRWLTWAERRPFVSVGDPEIDRALAEGGIERENEQWMRRLDAHLSKFEPERPVPTLPDGRPKLCGTGGFFFCGAPPAPAWGVVPEPAGAIDPRAG